MKKLLEIVFDSAFLIMLFGLGYFFLVAFT
jgi:hypothetical protein